MRPGLLLISLLLPTAMMPAARAEGLDDVPPKTAPGAIPPAAVAPAEAPIAATDERPHYALGVYGHGVFAPSGMLSPFLSANSGSVSTGALGAHFTRRKGSLDVVISMDFGWYSPPDGNFLGAGKDAKLDTHYVQFRGLNVFSADVSFYYNHDLGSRVGLFLGGGIGLGAVLGDVYVINNSETVCTADNAGDPSKCYPVISQANYAKYGNGPATYTNSMGKEVAIPDGPIKPGDPEYQAKMDGLERSLSNCMSQQKAGDCRDTAQHPYFHKAEKIPVVPVVNLQIGLRFKLHRHWNLNVSGGFRNGLVVGGGPEYVF